MNMVLTASTYSALNPDVCEALGIGSSLSERDLDA